MRIPVPLLFLLWACHPTDAQMDRPAAQSATVAYDRQGEPEEQEWALVLEIAASSSPSARQRLVEIKEHSQFKRIRTLATKILFLWSDKEGTYEAAQPRSVEGECLPISDLKRIMGERGEMVRLDVEVTVSPAGHAESVRILGGTPDDERMRVAVADSLMKSLFVPRRVGGRYERGIARLECKAHVR